MPTNSLAAVYNTSQLGPSHSSQFQYGMIAIDASLHPRGYLNPSQSTVLYPNLYSQSTAARGVGSSNQSSEAVAVVRNGFSSDEVSHQGMNVSMMNSFTSNVNDDVSISARQKSSDANRTSKLKISPNSSIDGNLKSNKSKSTSKSKNVSPHSKLHENPDSEGIDDIESLGMSLVNHPFDDYKHLSHELDSNYLMHDDHRFDIYNGYDVESFDNYTINHSLLTGDGDADLISHTASLRSHPSKLSSFEVLRHPDVNDKVLFRHDVSKSDVISRRSQHLDVRSMAIDPSICPPLSQEISSDEAAKKGLDKARSSKSAEELRSSDRDTKLLPSTQNNNEISSNSQVSCDQRLGSSVGLGHGIETDVVPNKTEISRYAKLYNFRHDETLVSPLTLINFIRINKTQWKLQETVIFDLNKFLISLVENYSSSAIYLIDEHQLKTHRNAVRPSGNRKCSSRDDVDSSDVEWFDAIHDDVVFTSLTMNKDNNSDATADLGSEFVNARCLVTKWVNVSEFHQLNEFIHRYEKNNPLKSLLSTWNTLKPKSVLPAFNSLKNKQQSLTAESGGSSRRKKRSLSDELISNKYSTSNAIEKRFNSAELAVDSVGDFKRNSSIDEAARSDGVTLSRGNGLLVFETNNQVGLCLRIPVNTVNKYTSIWCSVYHQELFQSFDKDISFHSFLSSYFPELNLFLDSVSALERKESSSGSKDLHQPVNTAMVLKYLTLQRIPTHLPDSRSTLQFEPPEVIEELKYRTIGTLDQSAVSVVSRYLSCSLMMLL